MIINTWRDPYDSGFNTTNPKQIEIKPGLTVLVGCNGAGKSTLLNNIKEEANKNRIPCHMFDNLNDGGGRSFFDTIVSFNTTEAEKSYAFASFGSSEGECIKLHINSQSSLYKEFFSSGYYKNRNYKFSRMFRDEDEVYETKERILLFDAVDSGLSVDSIVEIETLFANILKYAEENGIVLYMIISANEYELCRGNQCFDVVTGKYLTFKGYESYRKFILKSREKKERRIERSVAFLKKRHEKEVAVALKKKEKCEAKILKIKEKAAAKNSDLTRDERWAIRDLERTIKKCERVLDENQCA